MFDKTRKRYNPEKIPEQTSASSSVEVITILSSDEDGDIQYSKYKAKRKKTGTQQLLSSDDESDLDVDKSIDCEDVDILR